MPFIATTPPAQAGYHPTPDDLTGFRATQRRGWSPLWSSHAGSNHTPVPGLWPSDARKCG